MSTPPILDPAAELVPGVVVTFDIVSHAAEPLAVQHQRIEWIAALVAKYKATFPEIIWASGGDGGHLVQPNPKDHTFLNEILNDLVGWQDESGAALRISLNAGLVGSLSGGDGGVQLFGELINRAGHLINFSPPRSIVCSSAFREWSTSLSTPFIFGESPRIVYLKHEDSPDQLWLILSPTADLSGPSNWSELLPSEHRELHRLLQDLSRPTHNKWWEVIYRSKRILQLDSEDASALDALTSIRREQLVLRTPTGAIEHSPLFSTLGPMGLETLLKSSELVERDNGEIIVRQGDSGDAMFLILSGEVGVILPTPSAASNEAKPQDIRMGPGHLVGEISPALNMPRTATMQAIGQTALLSFTYRRLSDSLEEDEFRGFSEVLHRKVVEHVVRRVSYLGAQEGQSYVDYQEPWFLLSQGSHIISEDASASNQIILQSERFSEKGLYILIGGTLESRPLGRITEASRLESGFPILRAELERAVFFCQPELSPTSGGASRRVSILYIAEKAIRKLSPASFDRLVERVRHSISHQLAFDVFISYDGTHEPDASLLRKTLNARGLSTYVMARGGRIESNPQSEFEPELKAALISSRVLACLLTTEATEQGSWVRREVEFRRQIYSDEPNILPIQIDEVVNDDFIAGIPRLQVKKPLLETDLDAIYSRIRRILDEKDGAPYGRVEWPKAM